MLRKVNGGSTKYLYLSWSQTSGSLHGQLERHFTQWKRTETVLGGRSVPSRYIRLHKQSLCILQVYAPFLDEVSVALQKVTSIESILMLGDFNAHVGTDNKT